MRCHGIVYTKVREPGTPQNQQMHASPRPKRETKNPVIEKQRGASQGEGSENIWKIEPGEITVVRTAADRPDTSVSTRQLSKNE